MGPLSTNRDRWNGSEFGEHPERAIPSQAKEPTSSLGVCNEQVLPTKVKMCSELYRDVERLAEMTNSTLS
jgi:hypothetical protein